VARRSTIKIEERKAQAKHIACQVGIRKPTACPCLLFTWKGKGKKKERKSGK